MLNFLLFGIITIGDHSFLAIFYCSVGVHTDSELAAMVHQMEHAQLKTFNLTNDDLAKDHLRYFVCILHCHANTLVSTM